MEIMQWQGMKREELSTHGTHASVHTRARADGQMDRRTRGCAQTHMRPRERERERETEREKCND